VIYGSDVSGRSFASQLAKVRGADIPEAAKKLILKENLKRLLSPISKLALRQSPADRSGGVSSRGSCG